MIELLTLSHQTFLAQIYIARFGVYLIDARGK